MDEVWRVAQEVTRHLRKEAAEAGLPRNDVAQVASEAVVRAWQKPAHNPVPYVRASAYYQARQEIRREWKHHERRDEDYFEREDILSEEDDVNTPLHPGVRRGMCQDTETAAFECQAAFHEVSQHLDTVDLTILSRKLQGYTAQEIGRILQVRTATVSQRWATIQHRFRQAHFESMQ